MLRRPPLPAALATLAALSAGCGSQRLAAPDVTHPANDPHLRPVVLPAAGLRFALPAAWAVEGRQPPLVAASTSGSASIALWRYPRTELLPRTRAALACARAELLRAVKVRDPGFVVRHAATLRVDGARAVELTGDATIAGRPRRVRSVHVFAKGAELVVDALAAPGDFRLADRVAFRPLLKTLKIDPPT